MFWFFKKGGKLKMQIFDIRTLILYFTTAEFGTERNIFTSQPKNYQGRKLTRVYFSLQQSVIRLELKLYYVSFFWCISLRFRFYDNVWHSSQGQY